MSPKKKGPKKKAEPKAPSRPPLGSTERAFLLGALVVAAVLRLWHWGSMSGQPWFDFLGLDAKFYDDWAVRILREGVQGDDPYFMGPLYPHLMAFVYGIVGRSLDAVRLLQVVLSVGTVALMHAVGRQYGGPKLAMLSSAVTALYAPLVYYSVSILYPTLTVALAAGILWSLYAAAERRSLPLVFAAGLLLGVYATGRANILLFAPFAFFWVLAAWGQPAAPTWSRWKSGRTAAALLTAGTLLAIAPATLHNLRTGDPTLITTNGGLNFYIGNGPMASGGHQTPVLELKRPDGSVEVVTADLHQDIEGRTEAEYAVGRSLSYTEVSDFWAEQTWKHIGEDPGKFVAGLVMKTVHFWSTYEIPQIEHFGYFRQHSPPLRGPILGFALLGPFGLLGFFLAFRKPGRYALLLGFVTIYAASVVLFFVLARYRLPIVPALIPLAAFGARELMRTAQAARWVQAGAMIAGLVVISFAMNANFYRVDERKGIAQILYRHGIVADSEGRFEQAIEHYRAALELKEEYDKCHLNLGVGLARLGQFAEAERHVLRAQEINPEYYRAPYNLGLLYEQAERWDEARAAYARTVELEPRHLAARMAIAAVAMLRDEREAVREEIAAVRAYDGRWESGQNDRARAEAERFAEYLDELAAAEAANVADCFRADEGFRRAEVARLRANFDVALGWLQRYFQEGGSCGEAYLVLARMLLSRGDLPNAEDALERALTAAPYLPGVRLDRGRLSAARGEFEAAIGWFEEEIQLVPEQPAAYMELGLLLELIHDDVAEAEDAYASYAERGGDPEVLAVRRAAGRRTPGVGAPGGNS